MGGVRAGSVFVRVPVILDSLVRRLWVVDLLLADDNGVGEDDFRF